MNRPKAPENELLLLSMSNYADSTVMTNTLTIASRKGLQDGQPVWMVKHPAADVFRPLAHPIAYFDYEEGYEYTIFYALTEYTDDRKAPVYRLVQVLDRKKRESDLRENHELEIFGNTSWEFERFMGKQTGGGMQIRGKSLYFSTGCNGVSGARFKADKRGNISFDFSHAMVTSMGCMGADGEDPYFLENNIPTELSRVIRYEATQRGLKLYAGEELVAHLTR